MSGAPADVRRRPQFLAALVHHLLLGPACFHWGDERVLDLFLYRAQPLLSACRAALKTVNLAFQFPDPIFGSSQLKREPMRHGHRSLDVLFGDVSCFFQQTNHSVPSLINRFKFGSWPLLRSKSHDFSRELIHLSLLTDACAWRSGGATAHVSAIIRLSRYPHAGHNVPLRLCLNLEQPPKQGRLRAAPPRRQLLEHGRNEVKRDPST